MAIKKLNFKTSKEEKAESPVEPEVKALVDCPDCPIGKRTGKPSGLLDHNTLCTTCNGSGQVEAGAEPKVEEAEPKV